MNALGLLELLLLTMGLRTVDCPSGRTQAAIVKSRALMAFPTATLVVNVVVPLFDVVLKFQPELANVGQFVVVQTRLFWFDDKSVKVVVLLFAVALAIRKDTTAPETAVPEGSTKVPDTTQVAIMLRCLRVHYKSR